MSIIEVSTSTVVQKIVEKEDHEFKQREQKSESLSILYNIFDVLYNIKIKTIKNTQSKGN